MCVRPGIGASRVRSGLVRERVDDVSTPAARARASSRRYIRTSVAIWSLRERPARSLPPRAEPTRSINPRSRAVCTSSSSAPGVNAPEATSSARPSNPPCIASSSASSSRPAACSTRACAWDPAMSYGASRQSKWCSPTARPARRPAPPRTVRPTGSADRAAQASGVPRSTPLPNRTSRAAASLAVRP